MSFYVIDTNVLLYDPEGWRRYGDGSVVIATCVVAELEGFAEDLSELGDSARRALESLTEGRGAKGDLRASLIVDLAPLAISSARLSADVELMGLALELRDIYPERITTLITLNQRLQSDAAASGLPWISHDPERSRGDIDAVDGDVVYVSNGVVKRLFEDGRVALSDVPKVSVLQNQYVWIKEEEGQQSAIARCVGADIIPLRKLRDGIWGVRPRSREQHYALDALVNPEIRLVTLTGVAGAGKTLLSLAAGLQAVLEQEAYQVLGVTSGSSRPVESDRRPEDSQWARPVLGTLAELFETGRVPRGRKTKSVSELLELDVVQVVAVADLQGATVNSAFVFVDDAQNLTLYEAMSVISCMGEGSKIVFAGDPRKVSSPYVDEHNNGLAIVRERFDGNAIAAHIVLRRSQRSALASLASEFLR